MEESASDDERDNTASRQPPHNENAKRLKTEDNSNVKSSDESPPSSSAAGSDVPTAAPSTSSDSYFMRARNTRTRSYRRSQPDDETTNDNEIVTVSAQAQVAAAEEDGDESSPLGVLDNSSEPDDNSSASSYTTCTMDTDHESDVEFNRLISKREKPKHNWFMLPEIMNRQIGFSAKLQSNDLFQKRCYGSLHSVQRLELMDKLEEHNGCVNSLNFHYNGDLLASGSDDLNVVVWDWALGKCLLKYRTKHRGNVFQSKFLHLSGDLHIATCARDGQVRVTQVSKEEGVRNNRLLGSHKRSCHKLIILPEQPHIIMSAGEDGIVFRHDLRGQKSTKVTTVYDKDNDTIALYSINGHPLKTHEFVVCGKDEIVRTYDERKSNVTLATYCPFDTNKEHYQRYHVTSAVYNYNGSEILASYSDSDIFLFDVNSPEGKYVHQYTGHRNSETIKGVNFFGPKSEYIISGSDCGNIYFWDKGTESVVQWMRGDDNGVVNCLEPHPQLPFVCTSGLDWDIKLWVPSCETEPAMTGLADMMKKNNKRRTRSAGSSLLNERQMVWMLWRHLRNRNNSRNLNVMSLDSDSLLFHINTASSSSSSSNNSNTGSNDDSDSPNEADGPIGCNPS